MICYIVTDNTNQFIGVFTTRQAAIASVTLTFSQVPNQPQIVSQSETKIVYNNGIKIIENTILEQPDHL